MNHHGYTGIFAGVGVLMVGSGYAAEVQEGYPVKPIRLIVPFSPGGGTDIVARTLAQRLGDGLGQSVIVDNRAGGGGTIGVEIAVRAAPDGYTLALVSASYAANAALFKLSYDPFRDVTPISLIAETGFMVALHPGVPAKSVRELVALAKSKPGSLNYASTGTGGLTHMASELFDMMAGTRMNHVPYSNTGVAFTDLLSGRTQLIFGSLPSTMPHNRSGGLRGIAVTTAKRISSLPGMPSVSETVPGYEANHWYAVWGPRGLSGAVVARINAGIAAALASPALNERLASEGLEPAGGPPQQFRDVLERDLKKWTGVVKVAGIKSVQ